MLQMWLSTVVFYSVFVLCSLCGVLQGFKYAFLLSGFIGVSCSAHFVLAWRFKSRFKYAFLLSGFIGFSGLAVQICLSTVGFYRALWLGVGSNMPFYCGASCKVSPRFLAKWAPQYCCKVGPPVLLQSGSPQCTYRYSTPCR